MNNNLPDNWEVKTIEEISSIIDSGFSCNKSYEKDNGYVHLRTHNIGLNGKLDFSTIVRIDESKVDYRKSKLKKGDILFNNTNSKELVGKTAFIEKDYNFGYSNHLTKIQAIRNIVPALVVYYFVKLRTQGYFQEKCNKWIGQAGINSTALKHIEIPVPPLPEQRYIVAKLDSLFERIDKAIALVEQNIANAQHLMASVLNDVFCNNNWEKRKLEGITSEITKGTTPTTYGHLFQSTGINFVKIENLKANRIDVASIEQFITIEAHNSQKRSQLQEGDLLFSIAGTIGNVAIVTKDALPANTNQALAIIKDYQQYFDSTFLSYCLRSSVVDELKQRARGGALQNISLGDIKNAMVPVPSLPQQKNISEYFTSIETSNYKVIDEYRTRLSELKALKSSLLDTAFKGEL